MYLSDRDIKWAIEIGDLIIDPPPDKIDPTSVDLHLDSIDEAKIWDVASFARDQKSSGRGRPEIIVARYNLAQFGEKYLVSPPDYLESDEQKVGLRGDEVVVKPGGFLLWLTREKVGTPPTQADLICFVDGKSTRARAGIVVHMTAPTIHSTWAGQITLEIANMGPFDLVLREGDAIAQLTIAYTSSPPSRALGAKSVTYDQRSVSGSAESLSLKKSSRRRRKQ